ncbi:MAG TPA: nickel pincer cofactor biosynthesis protein LarC [Longimicrobiales bacterium]|nr:nickel pincer cofactor biosynthesis protein LarC [Longimicrobiales bacterium]
MRALLFDPFAGISGDMTIAALLDLGLSEQWLRAFVRDLGIGDIAIDIERVRRRGIAAPHVRFRYPPEPTHRHLRHVLEIIERAHTSARAQELARQAFTRIAEAEARVHGTTIDKVHFHEVGATDAILDVLCVMAAVTELGFDTFVTRPIAVGSGWIDIEHGHYPVPAPATLGILHGLPLTGHQLVGECTTPTGAALVATLTGGAAPPPDFRVLRHGFGAGARDPEDRPNVLRLAEIELADDDVTRRAAPRDGTLWLIQADVDDLSPEYAAAAQRAVLDAGALDAVLVHLTMKKGRPGVRLEALVEEAGLAAVESMLFRATSTIGIRRWPVQRSTLERVTVERAWRGQVIRFKRVELPDGSTREKPEFDDVVRAAAALGMTPLEARTALDEPGATADAQADNNPRAAGYSTSPTQA